MKAWDLGFYVRYGGDTIQLGPNFVSEKEDITRLINALGDAILSLD
jgi:beta-alanine--pyruvate transaminase